MRNTPPLEIIINDERNKAYRYLGKAPMVNSKDVAEEWIKSIDKIEDYLKRRKRY